MPLHTTNTASSSRSMNSGRSISSNSSSSNSSTTPTSGAAVRNFISSRGSGSQRSSPTAASSISLSEQQEQKLKKHLQRYSKKDEPSSSSSPPSSSVPQSSLPSEKFPMTPVKSSSSPLSEFKPTTNGDAGETNGTAGADEDPFASFECTLRTQLVSEAVGTYIMTLIGLGGVLIHHYIVHSPTTTTNDTYYQNYHGTICVLWAIGSMLGIYSAASVSGGHVNPAVTLAFALVRPTAFHRRKILPYIVAQICGATLASCTLLGLFYPYLPSYQDSMSTKHPSSRRRSSHYPNCKTPPSSPLELILSQNSRSDACDYIINDDLRPFIIFTADNNGSSMYHTMFVEGFGMALIVFVIFCITSSYYPIPGSAVPPVVATTIGAMMYIIVPLTTGAGGSSSSQTTLNVAVEIGRRIAGILWIVWNSGSTTTQLFQWKDMVRLLEFAVGGLMGDTVRGVVYVLGSLVGGPIGALLSEVFQNMT